MYQFQFLKVALPGFGPGPHRVETERPTVRLQGNMAEVAGFEPAGVTVKGDPTPIRNRAH